MDLGEGKWGQLPLFRIKIQICTPLLARSAPLIVIIRYSFLRFFRELFSDNSVNISCTHSGTNPWTDLLTVVAVSNSIMSFMNFHPRPAIKGRDDASWELLVTIRAARFAAFAAYQAGFL